MGKANRERRRLKQKARKRSPSPGTQGSTPGSAQGSWWAPNPQAAPNQQATPGELADLDVAAALDALVYQHRAAFEAAAARVADRPGVAGWSKVVERALTGHLIAAITATWREGWQPADLVRVARRQLRPGHVNLVRDTIAAELEGYAPATIDPRWTAQLAELDARVRWRPDQTHLRAAADAPGAAWGEVTTAALEVLDLLHSLPKLEMLSPPPGTARPSGAASHRQGQGIDERILARVRAMLAKAESTTFTAEADAFTAGAQALMARHCIDIALLAAVSPRGSDDPTGRRIGIDNPYDGPKAGLLAAVARANRCKAVWARHLGFSTVVGFPADLDAVEVLFTSLLIQATRTMTQSGSRNDAYGRSRTRAFRQSFLTAFAGRIGERLAETTGAQTAEAAAEHAGQNLLPVLAARDRVVEDAVTAMFPHLVNKTMGSVTDREGWAFGRSAADLANLGGATQLDTAQEQSS